MTQPKNRKVFSVDESITSGNVDQLDERFEKSLDKYFDAQGDLLPDVSEHPACPNCGDTNGKTFIQKRFCYLRCAQCDMVYATPRFIEEINNTIHSQDMYVEHFKCKVIPSIDYRRDVLAVNKYRQLMQYFSSPGKVLDIGCGLGDVLSVFKENGWECLGIDFNDFAIDYAKQQFGVKIINENIFDLKLEAQFDLVMLWGVLEHVYDPTALLKKAYALLNRDGVMLIEVPSADSMLVRYCEQTGAEAHRTFESARHIMLFSRKSLLDMCTRIGFRCENLLSNGLDVATLSRMKGLDFEGDAVGRFQQLLDDSLQGDLLRGFFRKQE